MFLVGIGTLHDQFCRRVAMHSIVHLVLNRLEEQPGRLGILVVIKRCCVQIRHFLVELALRQANFTNLLQLTLKIFIGEHVAFFQPFHIHRPALNGVVLDDLPRPLAELHSTLIIHLKADCNNHLKIVMILLAADLPVTFGLNCQVFLDSCLRRKFPIRINAFDVLGNRLL